MDAVKSREQIDEDVEVRLQALEARLADSYTEVVARLKALEEASRGGYCLEQQPDSTREYRGMGGADGEVT